MIKRITVKGAVQGVGYRPFIAGLAKEYGISGHVKNKGASVEIVASADSDVLDDFVSRIKNECPDGAYIYSVDVREVPGDEAYKLYSVNEGAFAIESSDNTDLSDDLPIFLPDIGICNDCMMEMLDKNDRRYRYPLISCASCGPRMSILNYLPYDRDTTTMEEFDMCPDCKREYLSGRRRHAQTISCHSCGPQMLLRLQKSHEELAGEPAIEKAVMLLRQNEVIGLKGISGYQLVAMPTDEAAVSLRTIKGRENKPFAVMFPDMSAVMKYCDVNEKEEELLSSSARPIVLLSKKKELPHEVCRGSRYIGAFLPSAGIHRLLCDELGPLIVTSANKSDMPMITDDDVFAKTFSELPAFFYHKRKINMAQDDSVMFVINSKKGYSAQFIRRARGFVPLPVFIDGHIKQNILAHGGDLKSSFCLAKNDKLVMSPYIGDLEDYDTFENYKKLTDDFERLFSFKPDIHVTDMHPGYFSRKTAEALNTITVQHHHAHILSVMAENNLNDCIGISFDGTGYGTDGNIWGGEFLFCKGKEFNRVGHLSYVKLCGGDSAPKNAELVKKCYMHAAGIVSEVDEITISALNNNINSYLTSSVGRLFDAVCALIEIKNENSFEGECAALLEKSAWDFKESGNCEYPALTIEISDDIDCLIINQVALFKEIYECKRTNKYSNGAIAYGFHMALTAASVDICSRIRENTTENKICLSGGVFANRILLTDLINRLTEEGFEVFWNRKVPSNDGGLALGQAFLMAL